MSYTKKQHEEVAAKMERDSSGHFIKKLQDSTKEVVEKFKEENVHYDKHLGGILDVHVRDPFQRIAELLEDLKKQKAFNFTLKGSLGIAGVAVALSVFGFFGGSKILCDKGVQTQVGTVKVLGAMTAEESQVPFLGFVVDFLRGTLNTQTLHNRVILETEDTSTIQIPHSGKINTEQFNNQLVYATGNFDNCSKVLRVGSIESYDTLSLP